MERQSCGKNLTYQEPKFLGFRNPECSIWIRTFRNRVDKFFPEYQWLATDFAARNTINTRRCFASLKWNRARGPISSPPCRQRRHGGQVFACTTKGRGNCPRLHPYRFRIQQTIEPWRNHKDASRRPWRLKSLCFHQNHMVFDPCEAATEGSGQSRPTYPQKKYPH